MDRELDLLDRSLRTMQAELQAQHDAMGHAGTPEPTAAHLKLLSSSLRSFHWIETQLRRALRGTGGAA